MNYHVYPENDIEPHKTDGSYCPCGITVEEYHNGHLIIHQSYDGREKQAHFANMAKQENDYGNK